MRIIEVSHLYGEDNKKYIELFFANVSISDELDTFAVPYLKVEDFEPPIIFGKERTHRNMKKGYNITQYKEHFNPVGCYVFKADKINSEHAREAIELIFEYKEGE